MDEVCNADQVLISEFCVLYVKWRTDEKQIKKEGKTFTLSNGTIKANPICRVADNAKKQLLTVQNEIGLTQAACERQKYIP